MAFIHPVVKEHGLCVPEYWRVQRDCQYCSETRDIIPVAGVTPPVLPVLTISAGMSASVIIQKKADTLGVMSAVNTESNVSNDLGYNTRLLGMGIDWMIIVIINKSIINYVSRMTTGTEDLFKVCPIRSRKGCCVAGKKKPANLSSRLIRRNAYIYSYSKPAVLERCLLRLGINWMIIICSYKSICNFVMFFRTVSGQSGSQT